MSDDEPIAGGAVGDAARARAVALVGRTLLDRYRVEELMAMGGIAAVFRAKKLATGEDVAIKVLHPDIEELPDLIERFEREAIAGRHIYHPNVAAVYEINRLEDGRWFMVMEFIRGITLRDLIDKGPVQPLRAARIAKQLATALNAAHDFGIIHRDVKPLNVMILPGPEERVQLIDFGLAKVPVDELSIAPRNAGRNSLTNAGVVFGTVAYMAPEAALGMRAVDKRADLYALGVILYEMLAGKHPFTAKDPGTMFAQHRTAIPLRIADRSPGVVVPVVLEEVVRRLMEKEPDARYPHARAVIAALDAAVGEMEGKKTPVQASSGGVRRGTVWLAGAGLFLAALAAVTAWLIASR